MAQFPLHMNFALTAEIHVLLAKLQFWYKNTFWGL